MGGYTVDQNWERDILTNQDGSQTYVYFNPQDQNQNLYYNVGAGQHSPNAALEELTTFGYIDPAKQSYNTSGFSGTLAQSVNNQSATETEKALDAVTGQAQAINSNKPAPASGVRASDRYLDPSLGVAGNADGGQPKDTQDAQAQPIDYTLRPGESTEAYHQRIAQARGEAPIPGVKDGTQPTGAQSQANIDYTLHPGESIAQYNARVATARGEIPGAAGTGGTNTFTDSGFADSQSGKGLTSGGQGQEPSTFIGIYKDIIKTLGLTDIKAEFKKVVEEQSKLQNELNDEISDINDNPWLSEGVRVKQIESMKEKYETKLAILTNKQQIYDSLYKEGVQQAQFLATGEYNAQADAAALAEKRLEAQRDLIKIDPNRFVESQDGIYDVQEQKWLVNPVIKTGTGGGNTPSSYDEFVLGQSNPDYAAYLGERKPATAAQQTVATYAARLEQAIPIIDRLGGGIATMNPLQFEAYRRLPSYLQGAEYRQFDQAARNLINATLRRESGAVISPGEFDNAYLQYLPRAGDDSGTLAQKKANRDIVYSSFKQGAGSAYQSVDELLGGGNNDPMGLR